MVVLSNPVVGDVSRGSSDLSSVGGSLSLPEHRSVEEHVPTDRWEKERRDRSELRRDWKGGSGQRSSL